MMFYRFLADDRGAFGLRLGLGLIGRRAVGVPATAILWEAGVVAQWASGNIMKWD